MNNGNLAPTSHSLCLCLRWRGDTRSTLLVSNVTAFVESIQCYLPHRMNFQDRMGGSGWEGGIQPCARGSARAQVKQYPTFESSRLPLCLCLFLACFTPAFLKGEGSEEQQIFVTYRSGRLSPKVLRVSLFPDLGKTVSEAKAYWLFRESTYRPIHAPWVNTVAQI